MTQKKDEIYFLVLNEVLKLEIQKGHLRWTFSEIAKNTKITRSLIYYYFGKDKEKLFEEAASFMAKKIWSLEFVSGKKTTVDRLNSVMELSQQNPYLFMHFYLNRTKENFMGKVIRESEKHFIENLQKEFPGLSRSEVFLIYILELGAISYQTLSKKQLMWVQKFLFGLYQKTKVYRKKKTSKA